MALEAQRLYRIKAIEPISSFSGGEDFLGPKLAGEESSPKRAWKMKLKRSQQIKMTSEARILRLSRIKCGLSMWKAGHLLNRSDSYISHIETGRLDTPTGERLEQFLQVYGVPLQSFYEQVSGYQEEKNTSKKELLAIMDRLGEPSITTLLIVAKGLDNLKILERAV